MTKQTIIKRILKNKELELKEKGLSDTEILNRLFILNHNLYTNKELK